MDYDFDDDDEGYVDNRDSSKSCFFSKKQKFLLKFLF